MNTRRIELTSEWEVIAETKSVIAVEHGMVHICLGDDIPAEGDPTHILFLYDIPSFSTPFDARIWARGDKGTPTASLIISSL